MKRRLLLILAAVQRPGNAHYRLIKYSEVPPLSLLALAGLTPEQLEMGYNHAKRQFATWTSILRRSYGLPGVLKRIAYNVAWMKIDPLWVAIIRAGLLPLATRIFERTLRLNTRAPGREKDLGRHAVSRDYVAPADDTRQRTGRSKTASAR